MPLARRDPVARPSVESLLSLQSCQDTWKLSQRFCLFPVSMTPISLHSSPIHMGGDSEERGERKGCLRVQGWRQGNTQRGQEVKGWEVAGELHDGPRSVGEKELSSLVPAVLHIYVYYVFIYVLGFPGYSDAKGVCLQCGRPGFDPWVRKIPWRKKWQPTPVLLPGKSCGWRSLVGYSPWGRRELRMTE